MEEMLEFVRRYPVAFVAFVSTIVVLAFAFGYDVAYRDAYLQGFAEKARYEARTGGRSAVTE